MEPRTKLQQTSASTTALQPQSGGSQSSGFNGDYTFSTKKSQTQLNIKSFEPSGTAHLDLERLVHTSPMAPSGMVPSSSSTTTTTVPVLRSFGSGIVSGNGTTTGSKTSLAGLAHQAHQPSSTDYFEPTSLPENQAPSPSFNPQHQNQHQKQHQNQYQNQQQHPSKSTNQLTLSTSALNNNGHPPVVVGSVTQKCATCHEPIRKMDVAVMALGRVFHQDHFRCFRCAQSLVGTFRSTVIS
jgi:hypothetical protein